MKQSKMLIGEGKILYSVVKEAIEEAGFSLHSKNSKTVLVWYDNLREADFYSNLKPWQVVNRIPSINLITRKAPFIQLMNRMRIFFPSLYTFYPESFILPLGNERFQKYMSENKKKYIVKPDGGSLGCGIVILSKSSSFKPFKNLSVAQEYIDSYLINDTKFDLRVYALIASVSPLRIYVYHDGVARFCSEKNSVNSIYSQLTNTAVNRNNPNAKIESITKTIKDVFQTLEKNGIDTDLIWSKIENAVILTILPCLNHINQGISQKCQANGYNRCFQILGFDFILDTDLNPLVLEVNYRPSLDADIEAEKKLKSKMLGTAMHIGAPLESLQKLINTHEEISNFSKEKWNIFFSKMSQKYLLIDQDIDTGLFNLVYPSKNSKNMETYNTVLSIVKRCPTKLTPRYKLPISLKRPDPSQLPKINPIVYDSNNIEIDDSLKQTKIEQEQHQNFVDRNVLGINSHIDQQKNMEKIKQQNIEKNATLNGHLKSKIIFKESDNTNNLFIKKLIEEINSIKEHDSNDSKTTILKNKQPNDQKLSSLEKQTPANITQKAPPTTCNKQKSTPENSNKSLQVSIHSNQTLQTEQNSSTSKPNSNQPNMTKFKKENIYTVINSDKEKNEKNMIQATNQIINANKEREERLTSKINTNKEINSSNQVIRNEKAIRNRRSASTRPVRRSIPTESTARIGSTNINTIINKNDHLDIKNNDSNNQINISINNNKIKSNVVGNNQLKQNNYDQQNYNIINNNQQKINIADQQNTEIIAYSHDTNTNKDNQLDNIISKDNHQNTNDNNENQPNTKINKENQQKANINKNNYQNAENINNEVTKIRKAMYSKLQQSAKAAPTQAMINESESKEKNDTKLKPTPTSTESKEKVDTETENKILKDEPKGTEIVLRPKQKIDETKTRPKVKIRPKLANSKTRIETNINSKISKPENDEIKTEPKFKSKEYQTEVKIKAIRVESNQEQNTRNDTKITRSELEAKNNKIVKNEPKNRIKNVERDPISEIRNQIISELVKEEPKRRLESLIKAETEGGGDNRIANINFKKGIVLKSKH